MAANLTIGTTTYPSIAIIEDQYDDTDNLQERGRLQCDVIDYVGTHFKRGEQVTVTDPQLGTIFAGFIDSDKERPLYPSGYIYHTIDCIGMHYLADKRTYTAAYTTSALAGKIAIDILANVLVVEGIVQNFAEHSDNTAAEFNTGNLFNAIGLTDPKSGNDYLEIETNANITIAENTTATFATGTLTSCSAINDALIPNTASGLKVVAELPLDYTGAEVSLDIWSGSLTLGSSDFLNYTMFISSTSPAFQFCLGLFFSDISNTDSAVDQNNYSDFARTDLTNVAKNTWYTRRFSLSAFSGKTINRVYIAIEGEKNGTYTAYFQNAYLDSGTVFLATNAVTTQLDPIQIGSIGGYVTSGITAQVLPVINANSSLRTSPAYSISSSRIVGSSNISWLSGGPSGGSVAIQASYDGGQTYSLCTNNSALPNLPSGYITNGTTLTLKEYFVVGSNPEIIPTLESVIVNIYSAPFVTISKNDDFQIFASQTQWNTGTYHGLTSTSSGDLTMGTFTSPWLSNSLANQFNWYQALSSSDVTFSISSSILDIGVQVSTSVLDQAGMSRLDWAGTIATTNGISIEFDVTVPSTFNFSSVLLIQYLQTYWYGSGGIITGNVDSTNYGAYSFCFQQAGISNNCTIAKGSNSNAGASTSYLATATVSSNPTHVKITVSSAGVHNVYLNGSSTATLTGTDTTYTSGQIAVGGMTYGQTGGGAFGHFKFSNATITPNTTTNGTWTSLNYTPLHPLIVDKSFIYWTEVNTAANVAAAFVSTSIDGGNSFQTCTNGGQIPGLVPGTDFSNKTYQISVQLLNTVSNLPLPIIRQLCFYVVGRYMGSVGIRDTAPLGNDTSITRTVGSGWGTAFDTQTWAQIGTGTTAVASNVETITNTTGDVNMQLGSRTATDQDCTIRFQLSASTIEAGITLRYVSASSFYRLFATPTLLTILKMDGGNPVTMATTPINLSLNTWYRMRFRIVGSNPITLYGNVWANGVLEPTINSSNGLWNNSAWTIESGE